MGLDFTIELKEVDESFPENLSAPAVALHIAEKKAKAFGHQLGKVVITADTIVALNGEILGKPFDAQDAKLMLRKLSGKTHEVYTGVCIVNENKINSFVERTSVTCKEVNDDLIDFYIDNFKPFDKAGSYGIQDFWGLVVVQSIEGSYTNVMGLPTEKLYQALQEIC